MFIDEKGRLFGKFNVLDVLIILLLIVVLAFGGWYFTKDDNQSGKKANVKYTVEVLAKDEEYLKHIIEGETVVDGVTKQNMGKIVGYTTKDAMVITENKAERKINAATIPGKYDVYIDIALDADIKYPDICSGSEKIKIGKGVALRSESVAMHGYIVGIDYDIEEIRGLK